MRKHTRLIEGNQGQCYEGGKDKLLWKIRREKDNVQLDNQRLLRSAGVGSCPLERMKGSSKGGTAGVHPGKGDLKDIPGSKWNTSFFLMPSHPYAHTHLPPHLKHALFLMKA